MNEKNQLWHMQGAALLIVVTTYCLISVLLIWKLSDKAGESIVGFAVFAQMYAKDFFQWLKSPSEPPSAQPSSPATLVWTPTKQGPQTSTVAPTISQENKPL